ncbi:sporulation and spore germination protein [Fontibacillus phaseoli]|uniref:Sporulation and spore germination protein n=1 Tax=Fontibacillus phaseoli TaxID=1416533 RepID=A0A369BRZ2_9BACL|nr:GerMN domain-containing protein [Fontibacillus phaseoli]RCX23366.1 sporulation and spore germination protein [Fontibacillus phaseoli]
MNRKFYITGMLVLLLALSTGCGQKPGAAPADSPVSGAAGNSTETNQDETSSDPVTSGSSGVQTPGQASGGQTSEEESIKKTIDSFFTDDQLLELKKVSAEITYKEEQDKYLAALKTLKESGSSDLIPLWGKVEFHTAKLENGELSIDITLPDEARLGAGGEVLALDALKQTMFQFQEVKSIELLVDGKQVDTLMGHEELEHPMIRN